MNITFAPRGILQIDDARIIFRNFSGRGDKFNREGDRNFCLLIENEEDADRLAEAGWNVKIKAPREEGDTPFMYMKVNVKFNDRGPIVYLKSGNERPVQLDEESIDCLDNIDIAGIDMDIRPYDWERPDGASGRTAYLQSIHVTQEIDRFAARYSSTAGFGIPGRNEDY